jgi:hypothetical protein
MATVKRDSSAEARRLMIEPPFHSERSRPAVLRWLMPLIGPYIYPAAA